MMLRRPTVPALCVAALLVACQGARPSTEPSLKDTIMPTPAHNVTFEAIAQKLLRSRPTASDLSNALGGPVVPPGTEVTFKLKAYPFAAVNVSEFRGDVDLVFDFAEGPWKFHDVVGEPAAWSSGPRLAHTGILESTRTWTAPGRSITCVVRLDGEGPLATLAVTGQARCQVSTL